MLSVLPHLRYTHWHALGEFVDNAIQSYLEKADRIKEVDGPGKGLLVRIDTDPANDLIRITDNAAGIAFGDFSRAFRPAEVPPDSNGLSEFGMGMKSAACWFGKVWRVRTSAIDDPVERTVEFDIPRIVEQKIEELEVIEREVAAESHYTVIEIEQVRSIPVGRTKGKIREHLPDLYRSFLRAGWLEIQYEGESLEYEEPTPLKAPVYNKELEPEGTPIVWRRKIDFEFGDGLRCHGHVGIRETGSSKYAGFSLLRRGRVIEGTADEKYKPVSIFGGGNTFRSQRVYGELNLDGMPVSHTKDSFRWDDDSETKFLEALHRELTEKSLPILQQAERYRTRAAEKASKQVVKDSVDSTARAIEDYAGPVVEHIFETNDPVPEVPEKLDELTRFASKTFDITISGGTKWSIEIDLCDEESMQDWIQISEARQKDGDADIMSLTVRIGLDSPFMKKIVRIDTPESINPVIRLAAGFALAEHLARAGGQKNAGHLRRSLNELLSESLSK
tara:strand:+ start:31025 stop:32536 length:1512 start_codon:yes stop_codon:yes gene_type:complete